MLFYKEGSSSDFLKILMTLVLSILFYSVGVIVMQQCIALFNPTVFATDPINALQNSSGNNLALVFIVFPWVSVCLGLIIGAKYFLKWPIASLFSVHKKVNYKKISYSAIVWFLINTIVLTFFTENLVWNFELGRFTILLLISVTLIPLQCIGEELLFRTFLTKMLGKYISTGWVIAVVTGTVFGLLHMFNPEMKALGNIAMVYYLVAGLTLGFLVIVDNGIELTTGFHIGNNLSAALIVTTDWQVFRTDAIFKDLSTPSVGWLSGLILFLSLAIFLILMNRRYKLKNGLYRLGKSA